MDRLTKSIFIFLGCCVALLAILVVFVERVPVRTYGVKQFIWAGGIEEKDYETGYHVGITGIHKWHLIDSSVHFLEFAEQQQTARQRGSSVRFPSLFPRSSGLSDLSVPVYQSYPALEIRNRDGNVITIDVSVPYRIIKGHAYKLVAEGLKGTYQERVKATVESVLREVLPEMSNEAIQDTDKRLTTAAKALGVLNQGLQQFHVVAEAVLIRRVAFPPDYETKLQEKQLLTQKALLDQADTLKLVEVLRTGTIEKEIGAAEQLSTAEWERKIETLRSEYTLKVATIVAEAEQYSKRVMAEGDALHDVKLAEGTLALDKAEATLDQLRTASLATQGGRYYLGRLAAQNLKVTSVTLNASDERVPVILDIHQVAELFVGSGPFSVPGLPIPQEPGAGGAAPGGTPPP